MRSSDVPADGYFRAYGLLFRAGPAFFRVELARRGE